MCIVVASTNVRTFNIEQKVRSMDAFASGDWTETTLHQNVGGAFKMGRGDTYAEAMADLFKDWDPDAQQGEISETTPEIMPPAANGFELI